MAIPETLASLPLDVRALDTESLRRLIQQSRAVLRNRSLIPDATLRKATTPVFTDDERTAIRRAASRFHLPAVRLAEEILALRTAPTVVTLQARDGPALRVTPLVRMDWQGYVGMAVTGTGHVCVDLAHNRYTAGQAAVTEYVLLDAQGQPALTENLSRRHGRWAFAQVVGSAFVEAWAHLSWMPTQSAAQIIVAMAGHDDTPQEALLTWCVGVMARRLQELADHGTVIEGLLGCPLPSMTVADLLRPALARVRMGATPRAVLHDDASHHAGYYHAPRAEWSQPLLRAIEIFLVGTNLIEPDLETTEVLEISLREVWERYRVHEHRATLRAGQLRAAVVARFGFQEITWHEEPAWVRTEPSLPPSVSAYQVHDLLKKQPHVLITAGCRIYVNGTYRCVVEGRSADLPHADQIVRRLLAVATSHRERIHTLAADVPVLAALFAPYRHARLWDLVSDNPEIAHTVH